MGERQDSGSRIRVAITVIEVRSVRRVDTNPLEVVIPIDGSIDAVRATRLVARLGELLPVRAHLVTTQSQIDDLSPLEYLTQLARDVGIEDPDIEVLLERDPVEVAAEIAEGLPGAHIGLSVDPRGRVLGSIAPGPLGRLLERTLAPIIAFGPHVDEEKALGAGPILIGVDAVHADRSALTEGVLVARLSGRPLHLVTLRTVPSGRVSTDRPFAAVDEAVAPVLEQARRSGVEARHSVEFAEDSGSGLAGAAKAIDALSVVVATHARHGLDRLLEGSDSLELVHRSTCPVILVHHDEASV